MRIVAINGLGRCGKSRAALEISRHTGMEEWPLAKPIKDVMCALFGWNEEHREGSYKEIPLFYTVTPESLNAAADVYFNLGLAKYESFHDCWDKLVALFGIELDIDRGEYCCIISPRHAFQQFGTEWGRNVDKDIWLKIAPTENVIIPDIRYDNEAQWFKDLGAVVLAVTRPGFTPLGNSHTSEQGISPDLVDYSIINAGTLDEYLEEVREFVRSTLCGVGTSTRV